MRPLDQEDIDRLQKIADGFNIELRLPPFKGRNNPFFFVANIRDNSLMIGELYEILFCQGFSFLWQEEDYVEIIGA